MLGKRLFGDTLKKSELVVKSNRLIEASYRLSLNEQRIILYAICRAREEQKGLFPELPVTISAEAFSNQFTLSDELSNVYRQLREAMDALFERSVTLHDTDPETNKNRVRRVRWISEASYIDGAGRVQVVFAPEVIKYITRLEEEFTSYQLEKVGRMTSAYAVRLYELLMQYRDTGTREMSLLWLRDLLQIEPGEYKLTADFMRRVLEVSVDQINKHTDLSVSYKPKKTGRAITDFSFKIKLKATKPKRKALTDQQLREQLETNGQQRIDEPEQEF
jgi:plasmid replication initiation protein